MSTFPAVPDVPAASLLLLSLLPPHALSAATARTARHATSALLRASLNSTSSISVPGRPVARCARECNRGLGTPPSDRFPT